MGLRDTVGMGIARFFGLARAEDVKPPTLGAINTISGALITQDTALTQSAVWAANRVLSEDVATIPLHLYRRQGRGKERATDHPLYRLLHDQPNPRMSSVEFRETIMLHLGTWGNAYVFKQRIGNMVIALWPLAPSRMYVLLEDESSKLSYVYFNGSGQEVPLAADEVIHFRGLSDDGVIGYSPVRKAAESIGTALKADEYAARFFGQGDHSGGFIVHPEGISDEAVEKIKKAVNDRSGTTEAHKWKVLREDMKVTAVSGLSPTDAQLLDTRRFSVEEICRWYRIPPHKLADLARATNNNIESQSIDYFVSSLRPWLVRIEQRLNIDLLDGSKELFFEHSIEGLLRGDIKTRYDAYAVGRQWGWLNADDIRELENMNPIPGGDKYLVPLNMVPADKPATDPQDISDTMSLVAKEPDTGRQMAST